MNASLKQKRSAVLSPFVQGEMTSPLYRTIPPSTPRMKQGPASPLLATRAIKIAKVPTDISSTKLSQTFSVFGFVENSRILPGMVTSLRLFQSYTVTDFYSIASWLHQFWKTWLCSRCLRRVQWQRDFRCPLWPGSNWFCASSHSSSKLYDLWHYLWHGPHKCSQSCQRRFNSSDGATAFWRG